MRMLLVTATERELAPLVARLTPAPRPDVSAPLRGFTHGGHDIDVLTTGVGMVATAAWCGFVLAKRSYDLMIDLGVCGSFDPAYPPGTVVNVVADCIPELGAEDDEEFLTVQQLGLLAPDEPPFSGGMLRNSHAPANPVIAALPHANGITVNTVHGNDDSIARVVGRFRGQARPQVETMEGAAFMYACLVSGAPFAQVRAVSNMVEKRNRAAWRLAHAVSTLNATALRLIEHA
jgi:futalosine hydrolase